MATVARSAMLIRSPVHAVFQAFVQPVQLKKFWLKSASGPLSEGAKVHWEFLVPGASEEVSVRRLVDNEQILFDWSDGIRVEILVAPWARGITRVAVEASGFRGRDAAQQAVDATEGFTIVLCDLKCLLESGSSRKLVRDKAKLIAAAHADAA
jgi:uncharacterized protein YndB with AHSA1/START domain